MHFTTVQATRWRHRIAPLSVALVTSLIALHGCGPDLSRYEPSGPSARECFSLAADGVVVVGLPPATEPWFVDVGSETPSEEVAQQDESDEDVLSNIAGTWDHAILRRASKPDFRVLCALVNGCFGQWRRLVVVERFWVDPAVPDYGFIVLADTPAGLIAVTKFVWQGQQYVWGNRLRLIRCDPRKAAPWLKALDEARRNLPRARVWNDGVIDVPLFLFHDIRPGDGAWSFALHDRAGPYGVFPHISARLSNSEVLAAWGQREACSTGGSAADQCGHLVLRGAEMPRFYAISAGYAQLIQGLWEGTLGWPRQETARSPAAWR